MKKRTLSLLLAVCMVLQLCSSMAFAAALESDITYPISGKCGMNLTWTLDGDGTMTISGSGAMFDYSFDEDNEEIPYREPSWLDLSEDIRKIVIEEGVTSIGSYAFSYLDNLTTVEVAASVIQVASNAFHSFEGTVPCNVLFLGDAPAISSTAVSECYNLRGIFMEDKLGWDTLLKSSDYYYANINWFGMDENGIIESGTCDENLSWTISADFTLTISGSGKLVWGIWPMAAFTTLVIEEGITSIGDYAFCMLGNLKKVTIPATVTEIGERAFDECYNIAEITFKGDAPAIDDYAFNYAGYYDGTTAYYPEGNATWTEDVLQNYGGNLTWLALPMDNIEDGGEDNTGGDIGTEGGGTNTPEAPAGITWSVSDDGTVLTISGSGEMVDYDWQNNPTPWDLTAVQQVVFAEGCTITSIGKQAFMQCGQLEEIDIPDSVKTIGDMAFYGCENLASVHLPEGLETIGVEAFCMCPITETTLPEGVTSIGSMAFAYGGLTEITVLTQVEPTLGDRVFAGLTLTTYANWPSWSSDQWGTILPIGGAPADTTPPTLTIDGPADGATLIDTTTVFTVSAQDDSGAVSVVMAYTKDGTTHTDREAPFEMHLYGLGNGPVTVTFTATDPAGNQTVQTLHYTSRIHPEAPTDLRAEVEGGGIRLSWTEGTYTDNIKNYLVMLDDANGVMGQRYWLPTGTTTWLDTKVEDGVTYTYSIVAEGTGSLDSVSDKVTITYVSPDTTPPVIADAWPTTEDNVTFCHDGTLQVAATDETALDRAEVFADGMLIGSANFNANGIASIDWNCAELSGTVTLTYVVYDKAGNSAEQTASVTVRAYEAPKTPENLTVENGFRSGTLRWSYSGDLQTLKQFNIYDGDPEGGMLAATVRGYSYTFRNLEEALSFKVAAVDIYGNQSFSTEAVTIDPILTEHVAPKAVMQLNGLTGLTGKAINFSAAGSSDNDAIAAYVWDFGDGATGEGLNAAHTYASAGTYTVTLTVTDRSGNTDTAQATVTIVSTLGPDATHAVLTVTVLDGYTAGTPAIPNATVTVYNDTFELAALTKADGRAELVVPKGSYTMTVVASGFDGKAQQIEVAETGASTLYLAQNGVSVVDGELTVEPMTREEIEEAGIDTSNPANSHVVKQSTTIRFQPMPELQFELPIEQLVNAAGDLLQGTGFGWHTFTPDPPEPDDPEEDDDDDHIQNGFVTDPTPPKYDVGVFPVGDSAYMVIYGQSHWLKEMFNVELIVYNNSYAQDIEDCVAELNLPEGLSLAAMLEGEQSEQVYVGPIDYIGKTDGAGTAIGLPTRQVNWYVRGDAEGDYNLTAAVSGYVGGDPFQTSFTTSDPIHVYAGSALKLIVTMPKSAYAEKDYAVKFSLQNVSDKPIYDLTFGIDTAQQFVAERMSDGSTGEIEREYSNEDFEGGMTYGLPTLEPGKAFNLVLRTNFAHENQFLEWAIGKVPGAEVGYQVADVFVTTLEGSTTEIPVEIILEDVQKDSLFQWVWDNTLGAFKDGVKDTVIEFVDDKVFKGIPIAEKGVEIFEVVTNIKDEFTDPEIEYTPTVNVTEGVQCVPRNEVDDWLSAFDTYGLRRSAAPGVLVWTDAADAVISEDGRSMQLPSGGRLYTLRLGETAVTPEIAVTTYYVDADGSVQPFTQTLTSEEAYTAGLQNAKYILLEQLTENTFEIPETEGETLEVSFDGYLISEDDEILLRAANEKWSITGEKTDGLTVADGTLVIGSEAKAGTYTVQLALEGTDKTFEQTILLTGGHRPGDVDGSGDVNVGDATYLLKFLAGLLPDVTLDPAIADMDGNNIVDVGDATYLMKMLAGLVPEMQ